MKDVVEGKVVESGKPEEPIDKRTMRDFLLIEKGELESWRCILPTGSVVRYKNNGNAQVNLHFVFSQIKKDYYINSRIPTNNFKKISIIRFFYNESFKFNALNILL